MLSQQRRKRCCKTLGTGVINGPMSRPSLDLSLVQLSDSVLYAKLVGILFVVSFSVTLSFGLSSRMSCLWGNSTLFLWWKRGLVPWSVFEKININTQYITWLGRDSPLILSDHLPLKKRCHERDYTQIVILYYSNWYLVISNIDKKKNLA